MRAVNLLPEDIAHERRTSVFTTSTVAIVGGCLLAFAIVFVGVSFFQAHSKVSDRNETLSAVQHEVDQLRAAQAAAAASSATAQSSNESRVAAFTAASSARMNWDNLLDDVSRVLPAGSWLTSLNMQAGSSSTTAAGTAPAPTAFTVSGIAFSHDVVAKVMQRLSLVPALSNVTLQQSTSTTTGSRKTYQFTMSANIAPPEVAR
jgi:Tfp pilus assembly protein PilN